MEIVRQDRNMDVKKPVNAETSTGSKVISLLPFKNVSENRLICHAVDVIWQGLQFI